VNRALLLGCIGGVIAVAALILTFFVERGPQPDVAAVVKSPPPASPGTAADRPPSRILAPDIVSPRAADATGPVEPSFDVVRVNPRGDAVIAGRAEPNAEVTVRDGGKEIGKAKADARGEWVVVPKKPLPTGSRELTLTARPPKGKAVQSQQNVVVVVPERIKGSTESMPGPLAVLVPREGTGESIVVQKPGDTGRATQAPAGDATKSARATDPANEAPAVDASALSIEAVDYDESGHVIISGRATPDARLHVYIENRFAGAGVADSSGRWRLVPGSALEPGFHVLRVDQVDRDGTVKGRVETRFARSRPADAVPPPGDNVVFVEPGNSLWRIARRIYGQGIRYTVIYKANREQIRDPDLIYPGQVFFVPHVN
jgi:nucleoid-associated protein YgaU